MATCSLATLLDQACENGFRCVDEQTFRGVLLQLLCDFQESGGGGGGASGGYTITFVNYGSNSPTDGETNYVGGGFQDSDTYSNSSILIPKAGTITRWFIKILVVNPGSSETVQHFLRINDSADVGQIDLAYDTVSLTSLNTTVSQAVSEGDSVAIKIAYPTWVTIPSGVVYYGYAYIE